MASEPELRTSQKTTLFDLLDLKAENDKAGIKVIGPGKLIAKMEAVMEEEDVAYVEKKIAELTDNDNVQLTIKLRRGITPRLKKLSAVN